MTDDPTPPANYTYVPPGPQPTPVVNFLNFADPWIYTLTGIQAQTCAGSATEVCTGIFKLVQVGNTVSVNMAGMGTITNELGEVSNFNMLITGNFTGDNGAPITIAQVIAGASSSAGIFSNSWSGELSASAVPEPGTVGMGLFGMAAVAIGSVIRRRLS